MDIFTREELGTLARQIREKLGLSQAEVAARLSGSSRIAQNHVSLAERGHPKYSTLAARIVEELGGRKVEPVYRVHPADSHYAIHDSRTVRT